MFHIYTTYNQSMHPLLVGHYLNIESFMGAVMFLSVNDFLCSVELYVMYIGA